MHTHDWDKLDQILGSATKKFLSARSAERIKWKINNDSELDYERKDVESEMESLMTRLLSNSVPFYSPGYLGHMNTDVSPAAIVGMFMGMLLNQNNITAESSPETTKIETAVIEMLAKMVGYPSSSCWGYICSGGTLSILWILWCVLNLRLFPYAVYLACDNKQRKALGLNDPTSIRCFSPDKIKELNDKIKELNEEQFQKSLDHSLSKLGLHEFLSRLANNEINLKLRVYAPQDIHYSVKKALRILGLGEESLILVDLNNLRKTIQQDITDGHLPLILFSLVGSTETGRVDNLLEIHKELVEIRKDCFVWWHADACYGGYFASVLKKPNGEWMEKDELKESLIGIYQSSFRNQVHVNINIIKSINECFEPDILVNIKYLSETDSVTVDPHKTGFVPYPAGAILVRDGWVRKMVLADAPYLWSNMPDHTGKYTVEGSRPGMAAVACYLAHHCVPLHSEGHGKILLASILNTILLFREMLETIQNPRGGASLIPVHKIHTSTLCYIPWHKKIEDSNLNPADQVNSLVNYLADKLQIPNNPSSSIMVVRTKQMSVDPNTLIAICGEEITQKLTQNNDPVKLDVLRSVCMGYNQLLLQDFHKVFVDRLCAEINAYFGGA